MAQPDGSLVPHLGGSPYNLACATALQGASVGFIAPLSTDAFGQALLEHLQANHARSLLPRSALPTSLAVVQVHEGQPSYGFYREGVAERDYQVADVVALLEASPPGILHTGSLMAMPHRLAPLQAGGRKAARCASLPFTARLFTNSRLCAR